MKCCFEMRNYHLLKRKSIEDVDKNNISTDEREKKFGFSLIH